MGGEGKEDVEDEGEDEEEQQQDEVEEQRGFWGGLLRLPCVVAGGVRGKRKASWHPRGPGKGRKRTTVSVEHNRQNERK